MIVNSSLVTFYKNPNQDNEYCIDIRDLDNSGPDYYALKRFSYTSDVEVDDGSLVVQENAILIAPHNKMLNLIDGVWYLNDFVSTTPVVRSSALNTTGGIPFPAAQIPSPYYGGGTQGVFVPSLEQNKEYAYKARYVYRDGHKTKTCFPVYLETTTLRKYNAIEIEVEQDIDDGYCDIEIFRKQDGEEFFLIERIKIDVPAPSGSPLHITFIDDGKPELSALDEKEYVWTKEHQTHAIARDRYVRANVTYPTRELDATGLVDVKPSSLSNDDDIVPGNCRVDVFVRKRQEDGLLSFHKAIGGKTVQTGGDQSLYVTQSEAIDAKEVALYAKYKSLGPTDFMSFNTPEIYNVNIASIATNDEDAKDKPANPHILLGWRYVTAKLILSGSPSSYDFLIYEEDWDTNPSSSSTQDTNYFALGTVQSVGFPETYTFNKFGVDILYIRRYIDVNNNTAVYEMAMFEGLKTAISKNKVKIKLVSGPSNRGTLSTELRDTDIVDVVVDVVGIVDESGGDFRLTGTSSNPSSPYGPIRSRVYLLAAPDSVFTSINNAGLIDYVRYKKNHTPQNSQSLFPVDTTTYFRFTLSGVSAQSWSPLTQTTSNRIGYVVYDNNYFLTDRSGDVFTGGLIYLGKSTNTTVQQGPLRTGYKKIITGNFITNELLPTNIYETLVTQEDVGPTQVEFPTQIIWSDSYIVGTDISGNRTFNFTNFLSIQRDYGDIVRIESLGNRLVVFCERGVAVCLVGETLAQSPSGQTFVNATQFITNPTWVLKSIPSIQPKSIKQYEGMLFFCDGRDVWMFTDSLQNISQGAVTLTGNQVASIDPLNKEYRISGGGKTYAYSIETQQWFGPHTYEDQISTVFADRILSVAGGHVVEHNKTNLFGRDGFDTVVESVANELNEASIDKIYRKFYIEHEGGETFEYGKDYTNMTEKELAGAASKQGLTHVGVSPANATARQIFWRIKSAAEGFKLKMISFNWTPRTRR